MDGFGGNRGAIRFVAVLGAVAGILLILWGVRGIVDVFDDIQNIDTPGPATVTLEEGASTVYFDMDANLEPAPGLLQTRLTITGPDGSVVAADPSSIDISLQTPSRNLVAVLDFDAPADGDYVLVLADAERFPPGELAVGPRFLQASWRSLVAIIAGAALTIGGIIGFFVSLARGARRTGSGPVPTPEPRGGWGGSSDSGRWGGGSEAADEAEDEAMWGDGHDWSDEFDEVPQAPGSGRDDGWGSGRTEGDDTWRFRDSGDDHDDGLPPPPRSF